MAALAGVTETAGATLLLLGLLTPLGSAMIIGSDLSGIGFGVVATLLGVMTGLGTNAYRLERLLRAAEAEAPPGERRAA
jgi:hypothetical protein